MKGDVRIAIYHFNVKIVSRGKGASAVAKAAYISGEKIKNEYGRVHTIKNKNDGKQVVFFANCDKEKVIDVFHRCYEKEKHTDISHDNNQNKSVKKHRSR